MGLGGLTLDEYSAPLEGSLVSGVRGYNRFRVGFVLFLSHVAKEGVASKKLGILKAAVFGEWRDGTRGYELSARGRRFCRSIEWVVVQTDNKLDGIANVKVRPTHVDA